MTAEIAILNKEAIALAADSAVTMTGKPGQKIFISANKLFALSKYHPVGIMIYGSAVFMGVPWETIIKIYRNNLGKKKLDTLKKYADDFMHFLDNGNPLFPESVQETYVRASIYGYFKFIEKAIREKINSEINEEGGINDETIKQIVSEIVEEHYGKWEKTDNAPSISEDFSKYIIERYGRIINEEIKKVFERLPIPKSCSVQLMAIAASLFSKFPEEFECEGLSGAVIAGFGEEDTFPSLNSFDIEGVANNKLKYKEYISTEIGFQRGASIIPFAQKEMVATFMEGIDPYLQHHIEGYLSEIFCKYPEIIVENIKKLDDNEKRLLRGKLKQVSNKIFEDYRKEMKAYRKENYWDPVTSVVAMLPKDELAAMAESLVSLTAFKRKVTLESETVAGPIDVAVISKGDGFIWIKRKHYFEAQLNPQFFENYYKERWDGQREKKGKDIPVGE